jgi:hypothetical protein
MPKKNKDLDILVSYCAAGCLNDGVCNPIMGTCTCPSGFTGTQCEVARSKIGC